MPVWAVSTITGGRFFGRSNQKSASLIPNYVGGITVVQLGAEVRNEGSADKCIQRADECR